MADILGKLIKQRLEEKSKKRVQLEPDLSSDVGDELLEAIKQGDSRAFASSLKNFIEASKDN